MVQNYKKNLTYASKSKEKFSFFSIYKQISISKIFRCLFSVPHLALSSPLSVSGATIILYNIFQFYFCRDTLTLLTHFT